VKTKFQTVLVAFLVLWLSETITRAQQPELIVQTGHTEVIHSVAFSPDGKILASGSRDKTIKLWEVASGTLLRTLDDHASVTGSTTANPDSRPCVTFSPDGKILASGSQDNAVKLWDVATGKVLRSLTGHSAYVYSLAFSPNGQWLASGSRDRTIKLWELSTGRLLRTLTEHKEPVFFVAFSPDSKTLVSAGWDNKIRLWDTTTAKARTLSERFSEVTSVALSPNGKFIAIGSQDKAIKLSDLATGKARTIRGHADAISAITFSLDSRFIASASRDKTIKLWDVVTAQSLRTLTGYVSEVDSLAFSPDGQILAGGFLDSQIKLWGVTNGQVIQTLAGHSFYVKSVAVSPDGQLIASGSQDHTVKLWRPVTSTEVSSLAGHSAEVNSVAFGPDNKLLASGSNDGTIKLWDVTTNQLLRTLSGHSEEVFAVAFSPDGNSLASAGRDRTIRLWDVTTGALSRILSGHLLDVNAVVFSPDGRTLASGSVDRTIKLWNVSNGVTLRTLTGHLSFVNALAYSHDGRTLASGGVDKTVRLWDVATGRSIHTLTEHTNAIASLAFSPDDRTLASGGWDMTIKLWDVATGTLIRSFNGHSSNVSSVVFAPDGRILLSGSLDTKINLWEAATGKELGSLIVLDQKDWAVVSPEGRFDASPEGMKLMHWMVGSERIILDQLKERYYEPGLLGKLLGFNKEPLRDVTVFRDVKLFPAVEYQPIAPNRGIATLTNRGGGIGQIQVFLNNKEIIEDARNPNINPNDLQATIELDLNNAPWLPDKPNNLSIVPRNAEGSLSGRGVKLVYPPAQNNAPPPELYAIVAGISQYSSPSLELNFAAKDALDMANALLLGAKRLFGAEKVHLTLLTTANHPSAWAPTKANFVKAFEEARKAKPGDVLVVYLAGHGIQLQQISDIYCYLTREARDIQSINLDSDVRSHSAITSEELARWLKLVPAHKQVTILDTCAAGAAAAKLVEKRNISGDTVRAITRLKDRTGTHLLMGSTADAVSYEASQYGQGVLTYALLQGMKGEALHEGEFVDVSKLFQYARDQVPQLARNIGGIQKPTYRAPEVESYEIGQLTLDDRAMIVLAKLKPMILPPHLTNPDEGLDNLEFSKALGQRLREECNAAARGEPNRITAVYVNSPDHPDALQINGFYKVEAQKVTITINLIYKQQRKWSQKLEGSKDQRDQLVNAMAATIIEAVKKLWEDGSLS
jgi:WD40 repeat protein/uncharacterized caspase-like protein